MGSASKIVLVGAASLIIGIYSVALKKVETNDLTTSISRATQVQMEKNEDQALRTSLYRVQFNRDANSGALNVGSTRAMLGGGTYTYSFPNIANLQYTDIWGTVTVTPPTGDAKVIDVRIDKVGVSGSPLAYTKPGARRYVRGQWQITEAFVRTVH